jgi:phage tail sheath gpL-like
MAFDATSLAAITAVGVQNVQFLPSATNLARKFLIIGSYDNTKTIVDNVPVQILSPEDAGDQFGFGSMIHRLALAGKKGTQGLETWVCPQPEAGGAAAAAGEIDFTPTTVEAGTVHLYIAGDYVPFNIAASAIKEDIADACVAAINADTSLPVTAVKVAVTFEVTITAKTLGTYGNEVSIEFNLNAGQVLPTGLAQVTTDMTGGTGTPVIADALNGLGTGSNANSNWFTDVVHGYLQDATTLDAIETYGGSGNGFNGLYAKEVGRPFRVLTGDTVAGSGGFTALKAVTDARLEDRVSGIIPVPGSATHPSEIAAQTMGIMARVNQNIVAQGYAGQALSEVWAGSFTDDWTSDYATRDLAVKSGMSTTKNNNGVIVLQNMDSMYRPANVPVDSNGYRQMVNIAKLQNIINSEKINFEQEKWQGNAIVADKTKVNAANQSKVKDIQDVIDDLFALADSWEANGWIYSASFTKTELAKAGSVTVRSGGVGFDVNLKLVLSGEGTIINITNQFDTSLAVFGQ